MCIDVVGRRLKTATAATGRERRPRHHDRQPAHLGPHNPRGARQERWRVWWRRRRRALGEGEPADPDNGGGSGAEGRETVYHPIDYLLQYPPLDPLQARHSLYAAYAAAGFGGDDEMSEEDAAAAAALAEADLMQESERAAAEMQAREWAAAHAGAGGAIGGGRPMGAIVQPPVTTGDAAVDADAAFAHALLAEEVREAEVRQQQVMMQQQQQRRQQQQQQQGIGGLGSLFGLGSARGRQPPRQQPLDQSAATAAGEGGGAGATATAAAAAGPRAPPTAPPIGRAAAQGGNWLAGVASFFGAKKAQAATAREETVPVTQAPLTLAGGALAPPTDTSRARGGGSRYAHPFHQVPVAPDVSDPTGEVALRAAGGTPAAPQTAAPFDPFPVGSAAPGVGSAVRVPDLLAMGFAWDDVHAALEQAHGDVTAAQEILLDGSAAATVTTAAPASPAAPSARASSGPSAPMPATRPAGGAPPPTSGVVSGTHAGLLVLDPD